MYLILLIFWKSYIIISEFICFVYWCHAYLLSLCSRTDSLYDDKIKRRLIRISSYRNRVYSCDFAPYSTPNRLYCMHPVNLFADKETWLLFIHVWTVVGKSVKTFWFVVSAEANTCEDPSERVSFQDGQGGQQLVTERHAAFPLRQGTNPDGYLRAA